MYRISQLMPTPVASPSGSEREYAGGLSPTCLSPSFACDFLDGDSSVDCCSIDPLTGSHLPCRRSPRLLTNGYYIWTEDSFHCDRDGNITLSPSQTSVMYKENCEDSWLERVSRLDVHHGNGDGGGFACSLADDWKSEKPKAESVKASSSGQVTSQTPGENSHNASLWSPWVASEHCQGNILDQSKTSFLGEISFQTILLAACLIISACARWFLGGVLASLFTCFLTVTIAYVVKLLFLSLASYFKATPCARLAKI